MNTILKKCSFWISLSLIIFIATACNHDAGLLEEGDSAYLSVQGFLPETKQLIIDRTEPSMYVVGQSPFGTTFDMTLNGMAVDEERVVIVSPDSGPAAFYDEQRIETFPRNLFGDEAGSWEGGDVVEIDGRFVSIHAGDTDTVTFDLNEVPSYRDIEYHITRHKAPKNK